MFTPHWRWDRTQRHIEAPPQERPCARPDGYERHVSHVLRYVGCLVAATGKSGRRRGASVGTRSPLLLEGAQKKETGEQRTAPSLKVPSGMRERAHVCERWPTAEQEAEPVREVVQRRIHERNKTTRQTVHTVTLCTRFGGVDASGRPPVLTGMPVMWPAGGRQGNAVEA